MRNSLFSASAAMLGYFSTPNCVTRLPTASRFGFRRAVTRCAVTVLSLPESECLMRTARPSLRPSHRLSASPRVRAPGAKVLTGWCTVFLHKPAVALVDAKCCHLCGVSLAHCQPHMFSSGQSSWLKIQRSRVPFPTLTDTLSSSGSGTGSTQPREDNRGAT
jgi:hypothetical protein